MRRTFGLVLLLAMACLVAGCGQKGPLTLPPTKPASAAPAPTATPAPAAAGSIGVPAAPMPATSGG